MPFPLLSILRNQVLTPPSLRRGVEMANPDEAGPDESGPDETGIAEAETKQAPAKEVTMKEVAAHAGVALSSVSRVLNDHSDVSESMRKQVLDAIEAVGYEPNLLASSLRRGSTMTVGFIANDISNPLFAEIAMGAERRLNEAGYSMVLTNSEGNPERDEAMIRLLRWRRIDGLILSVSDEERAGTLAELAKLSEPVVLVDREMRGAAIVSAVLSDHANGMQAAIDHLLELGHRRVALISGRPGLRPVRERVHGFKVAFRARGLDLPTDLLKFDSFSASFGEQATYELLAADDPPTAIVAGGNLLLIGVLRALQASGRSVGSDISLVSCDDVPLTELHSPPITVIDRDAVEMGEAAADLLLKLLAGGDGPLVTEIPTSLIRRASTQPHPTG